ncbi:MAG: outer membrane beta-barrel protein [Elusimicrobiota bacterium]|nr:outer membrane beta-barrel protein [Elusimicrobiota bacterium]
MFKKIVLSLVLVSAVSVLSFADVGISARLGRNIGENNNFDSYLINTGVSSSAISSDRLSWYKDYDRSDFINYGVDIFCEYPITNKSFIGLKAGYTAYVNTDAEAVYFLDYYKYKSGNSGDAQFRQSVLYKTNIESDAYEIPITIYYKERINKTFSFFAGAGISFLSNKWTANYRGNINYIDNGASNPAASSASSDPNKIESYSESETSNVVVPLFLLGAEARMSKHFALTFDITFRYGGKTTFKTIENFELTRNFSGVAAALGVKYYLFGIDAPSSSPKKKTVSSRTIRKTKVVSPEEFSTIIKTSEIEDDISIDLEGKGN